MPWPLLVERASSPDPREQRKRLAGWAANDPSLAASEQALRGDTGPPSAVTSTWADDLAREAPPLKTEAELHAERESRRQRQREAEASRDNAGARQAFARSLVTRAANAAASPVTLPARALRAAGVPGLDAVADLDANEAYADAESLLRDEHVAQTRERHRVTADANPIATELAAILGDATGGAGVEGLALRGASAASRSLVSRALAGGAGSAIAGAPSSYADARERAYREGGDVSDVELVGGLVQRAAMGGATGAGGALWAKRPPKTTPAGKVYFDEGRLAEEAPKILGQKLDDAAATRLMGHHPALTGETHYYVVAGSRPGSFTINMSNPKAQLSNEYYRENGDLVATIDVVNLKPEARQQGIASELLRQQLAENERIGVRRIDLLAAKDGRAVWPRMGFELKRPSDFNQIRARFDGFLRERGLDPAAYPATTVGELAREPIGREYLLSPAAPLMELTVDLRGQSGRHFRDYLGSPDRSRSSRSRQSAHSMTSSSKSDAKSSVPDLKSGESRSASGLGLEGGATKENVTTPGGDAIGIDELKAALKSRKDRKK